MRYFYPEYSQRLSGAAQAWSIYYPNLSSFRRTKMSGFRFSSPLPLVLCTSFYFWNPSNVRCESFSPPAILGVLPYNKHSLNRRKASSLVLLWLAWQHRTISAQSFD